MATPNHSLDENEIKRLESEVPAASGNAFQTAQAHAFQAGLAVVVSTGDALFQVLPDGTRTLIKSIEPPTQVTPGTQIDIR